MANKVDSCPACGAIGHYVVVRLDERRSAALDAFDQKKYGGVISRWKPAVEPVVAGCRTCSHAWYLEQPAPEQLSQMYEAGRPWSGAQPTTDPSPSMLAEMARFRALVGPHPGKPTLLDYGSGFGRWARAAAANGFDVTAYEPSSSRSAVRDAAFQFVADARDLANRQFDVIQLEQVLEHVPEPLPMLRDLRGRLAPHGILRLTVPNILRSPEGSHLWERWPYDGHGPHTLAPFEHLHGFTPTSLHALVRRAGLRPVAGAAIWRHYGLNQLRRLLGRLFPGMGTTTLFLQIDARAGGSV